VVSSLGDPQETTRVLDDPLALDPTPFVRLDHLRTLLTEAAPHPARPSSRE
jgi:hypothetical protein